MHALRRVRDALGTRYLVEKELGSGGMATVYLAEDLRHGRPVALKVVHPEIVDAVGRERFLREIQITANLSHPHIQPLLDSGEADGLLYYVMAVAEEATLSQRLKSDGALPVPEAMRLACEIAEALRYAHDHGVVHRDVKPSNVLMEGGHAVLADFGIAKNIVPGQAPGITATGVTLGTAEYMSPEQCSGDHDVDARSDIYSLGCVLHHMLAGRPPFTGRSTAAVVAQQLRDPPPPLRSLRPEVPAWLEAVVLEALEKDPSRRFQSAEPLRQRLRAGAVAMSQPAMPWASMRLAGLIMGALVVAAAVVATWLSPTHGPELSDTRFAVLSFVQLDSAGMGLVDGSRCQTRLREALARWHDVELIPAMVVRDRELRRNGRPLRTEDALRIATEVGAGRLVWGQVWQEGDSTRVEANLYDVASAAVLRSHSTAFTGNTPLAPMFDDMADSLIVGQVTNREARSGASGTRYLAALRLYDDGHRSLSSWELGDAAQAFGAAADRDPGYAHASLWRSLVGLFRGEEYGVWQQYAARAAAEGEALSGRERLLARGLQRLTERRWQEACRLFSQAVAQDSLSFEGWLGLGDCQARDPTVTADSQSPSGWSFVSSFEAAERSYLRALALAPSYAFVLQDTTEHQLERVFPVRVGDARLGQSADSDSLRFIALPELHGDTLAYVPWLFPDFLQGRITVATSQAVQRSQARLADITGAWLAAFPDEPMALDAHARTLEVRGLVASTGDPATSALDAARRSRALSGDRDVGAQVLLGTLQVRLLVKQERFDEARTLADSILLMDPPPSERTADALAGLAILTGHPAEAARRMGAVAAYVDFPLLVSQERAPVPLRETALRFAAFAAAGGPVDSLSRLQATATRQGTALIPAADEDAVMTALFGDDFSMAYTAIPPLPQDPRGNPGNPFHEPLRLLATGDTAGVRPALGGIQSMSSPLAGASIPFSVVWMESHLRLAVGDTTSALNQLDRLLDDLRSQDPLLLTMTQAGPLVRAMARRAELAATSGDTVVARRWATAVATLWADGDDAARSLAARMEDILGRADP